MQKRIKDLLATSPIEIEGISGNPGTLRNGMLWYDSTAGAFKVRANGSTVNISSGGGGGGGSGTVTSVAMSFTGGIVSVAGSPITASGTLAFTVAGTSGGVPYFSSSSGWASSGALAANALVIGGGAGAAPATTSTAAGALTFLGTPTFANLNSLVSDADLARTSGTNTFTGVQTFNDDIHGLNGIEAGSDAIAGTLVIWQGDTLGNYLALSTGSYLTTPRDWIFPDSSDTFVGLISTQTLTNKTISGSSNTLTNIALSSLAQSSATTGQVPTWNGSAWAAATPSGGSGDTYLVLASDTANSTTSFADVTGLTFAVTSGETYVFAAWVVYETAATTTGSKWAVNGPASPTILSYSVETPTAATTSRLDFASTYDGTTASSQTAGIGQCLAKIEGVVKVSASGTFALRFGSEVGSSAVTAKAGSFMRYRKIAP
jgi:hypothetical protein